jgi:TfoX/Sxy family transcriptional regulator of competence genes
MKWRQSPQSLIDTFNAVFPRPPAEGRKMFGFPAGFVNGNMFMGLHEHNMLLRLPEQFRNELLEMPGAKPFEPMPGRPMREYVVVPPQLLEDRTALATWIARSLDYAAALAPKGGAKKSTRKR